MIMMKMLLKTFTKRFYNKRIFTIKLMNNMKKNMEKIRIYQYLT